MSNPYSSPHSQQFPQPGYQPAPQENTLGLIGFIVSLLGLFVCPAAPVGLIISLMGLRREPKVFAIIGTIIGGLLTLFYVVILAIYGAMLAACIGIGVAAQPAIQTQSSLHSARQQIENSKGPEGVYPGEAEGNGLIAGQTDYWKTPLRYEPSDGGFVIRSAGSDKQFNTSDDMTVNNFDRPFEVEDFDEPFPDDAAEEVEMPQPVPAEEVPDEEMPTEVLPAEEAPAEEVPPQGANP